LRFLPATVGGHSRGGDGIPAEPAWCSLLRAYQLCARDNFPDRRPLVKPGPGYLRCYVTSEAAAPCLPAFASRS